jgi:peroxiredoxin
MKRVSLFITILLFAIACKNDKTATFKEASYTIKGEVKNQQFGEVYLQILNSTQSKTDTLKIRNGKFEYAGKSNFPELAVMVVANLERQVDKKNVMILFIEPDSKIKINIDTSAVDKYVVSGSKSNDEFVVFKKKYIQPIEEKEKKTFENVDPMAIKNPVVMDSLMKLAQSLQQEKKDAIINYIGLNKNSYIGAAYAYLFSMQEENTAFAKLVYNALSDSLKKSFYAVEMKNRIDAVSKSDVGAVAADFISIDTDGKSFKLSDFYIGKKIVLIDFWASWCGPCRKENPNVVKAYSQFHSKGFEVVGVSLDEEKKDWINAIAKDKLVWKQVSDLKGWESQTAKLYNVTAIPTNFLIDGTGKIIATNLRGDDLERKLTELLK